MKVKDIMSSDPACCAPSASVEEAARLMTERNCGEIPVVDSHHKPVGVVTDRDIACRAVAEGKGPGTPMQEVMSSPAITVSLETSIDDCCRIMEANQIRRVPVVEDGGGGVVAQADLARRGSEEEPGRSVHRRLQARRPAWGHRRPR